MAHQPGNIAKLASAFVCTLAIAACREPPQEPPAENQSIAEAPRLPIVEPPFDRARLLLAVARAASAHSAGTSDPSVQRSLDGKQFEVRLRFGCEGPGPGDGDYGWSLDPDGRTLRVRAVPTISLNDAKLKALAGEAVEAVEGFWLPRPWLLQATCPARQPAPDPASGAAADAEPEAVTAPVQRIGIAQFFTAEDARTRQRMNRPFEAVKQLDPGASAGGEGFNLVLSGRLRARPDGRLILCTGSGRDRPPDCVISVAIDRVWIENPADQSVIAEWSS